MKTKRKTTLILTAVLSLVTIFVCAVSTFAWFTLLSQPLQTSMVSGTGSVSLVDDSTYGYKINPSLGGDGKVNYANTVVTKKNGSSISTTNNNLDGIDIDFDVPDQGIGYYLVEQNAENNFTYTYNSVPMATKFVSKTGDDVNTHYIASKALSAKKYRIKKYTFVNNQTVYEQVRIETSKNAGGAITLDATGENATYDVTINTAGTYKIWLNYSSATGKWDLSLESTSYSIEGLNAQSLKAPGPKKANTSMDSSNQCYITFNVSNYSGWSPTWIQIKLGDTTVVSASYSSTYTVQAASGTYNCQLIISQGLNNDKTGSFGSRTFNANTFYDVTLSGDKNWSGNDFTVNSTTITNPTSTTLTIYVDTAWLSSWTGTAPTNPCINIWDNLIVFKPNNSDTMTGSIGEVCSYTFKYKGSVNSLSGLQFYCSQGSDTKYTVDLYLPSGTASGDKLYISLAETWNGDGKMNATIGKAGSPSGDTYKVYLFDPMGYKNSATFYCYAWKSNASVNPFYNAEFPGTAFTVKSGSISNLYQAEFSQSYDRIIVSDGANQMAAVTVSNAQGKYLVLNYINDYVNGTTNRFSNASWYADIAAVPTGSGNETTYYVYNKGGQLGSNPPKAYAWTDNTHSDFAGTYYYQYQNAAWPGVDTVQAQINSTNIAGLYSVSVPNTYDHIIFANGSNTNIQTVDLSISSSTPYFIFDGTSITTSGVTKYGGSWQASLAAITMQALFFVTSDGSTYTPLDTTHISGLTTELGRGATEGGGTFDPGSVSGQEGKDAINGILYRFEPEGTYWYKSSTTFNSTTRFTPNSTTLATGSHNLYKRMICDLRQLTTLYVDVSHSGQGTAGTYWQNISICGSGQSDTPYFSSDDSGANWQVGTNLYRFTVPSNYTVRVANSGYSSSGGNNTSSSFLVSDLSSNFIVIESANGSNCGVVACSDLATNIGTATIYVSTNEGVSFDASYTMQIGDQTSNDFVWERGIQISAGSHVYVDVAETNDTHNYYHYNEYIATKPTYIADAGGTYHNIMMTSYTGTARFNFYLTHAANPADRKLSIAMVPDYGNGYYIMPYSPSLGTTTFSGAIKMSSGSKISASYSGYYAAAGSEIFIRSYIDAVDTLYTAQTGLAAGVYLGTSDGSTVTAPGVLHFTNAGYYDIEVYNGSITVTSYSVSDFFKLNALNTNSVATRSDIKSQITSLVLEVQFKCNNTYASKMSLTADNGMPKFVGAALYCSASALGDPYNYLRNNHYNSITSTNNVMNDLNTSFVVPANSSATYYAYILVDYLPTEVAGADAYNNFVSEYTNNIYFYLNATQYIAS